jgi:hypothetical protein
LRVSVPFYAALSVLRSWVNSNRSPYRSAGQSLSRPRPIGAGVSGVSLHFPRLGNHRRVSDHIAKPIHKTPKITNATLVDNR